MTVETEYAAAWGEQQRVVVDGDNGVLVQSSSTHLFVMRASSGVVGAGRGCRTEHGTSDETRRLGVLTTWVDQLVGLLDRSKRTHVFLIAAVDLHAIKPASVAWHAAAALLIWSCFCA